MSGQLGREKIFTAFACEVIEEYQQEQEKTFMKGQEARMYMEASYEPSFPVSFEKLQTIDGTDSFIIYKAEVIQIMK